MEVSCQKKFTIAKKVLEETISKARKFWTREDVENNAGHCKQLASEKPILYLHINSKKFSGLCYRLLKFIILL